MSASASRIAPRVTEQAWTLVVLDINLADGSGLDLLPDARQLRPATKKVRGGGK